MKQAIITLFAAFGMTVVILITMSMYQGKFHVQSDIWPAILTITIWYILNCKSLFEYLIKKDD